MEKCIKQDRERCWQYRRGLEREGEVKGEISGRGRRKGNGKGVGEGGDEEGICVHAKVRALYNRGGTVSAFHRAARSGAEPND